MKNELQPKKKMNKKQKAGLATVVTVVLSIVGYASGGVDKVIELDQRWAYRAEHEELVQVVQFNLYKQRAQALQERIWALQREYQGRSIPLTVQQEIQRLTREMNDEFTKATTCQMRK